MGNFHRLLKRQIKNYIDDKGIDRTELDDFLNIIDKAYCDLDQDKRLLENIIEISEKEQFLLNNKLQLINQNQELIVAEKSAQLVKSYQKVIISEAKTKAILENLAEIVIIVDNDFKINYTSQNIFKVLGYELKDLENAHLAVLFDETKLTNTMQETKTQKASPTTKFTEEFFLKSKEGKTIEFEAIFNYQIDNELIHANIITLRDMSDLRSTQDKIKEQRDFYESILTNLPCDIAIFTPEHKYLYLNPIAIKDDELRKYIIGKDDFEYAAYRGRDMDSPAKRRKLFEQAKNNKEKVIFEDQILDINGKQLTMLRQFHPVFDAKNEIRLMIGFGMDVTFVKEAELAIIDNEAKLSSIMQAALDAIIILNSKGYITYTNPSVQKIFGWSDNEMIGFRLADNILPPEFGNMHQDKLNKYKQGSDSNVVNKFIEVPAMRKDGMRIIIELLVTTIVHNHEVFFVSFMRDITEKKSKDQEIIDLNKNLESKVNERTKKLEDAIKELEVFSYSVSHDLRSPLRGIDGWSLALLEDYGHLFDNQAISYLNKVRSESQRMEILIDDMLALSSIGRRKIESEKLDVKALVQPIFERQLKHFSVKNVEFIVDEGLELEGDHNLMEIMFENLISNAIKFSQKVESPKIVIGKKIEGEETLYFIRDNGVGFNMEAATKLFGAFQRMHKQSEFPGTGIGLATCRRIMVAHGGDIWAESKQNEGTCFYFSFN